MAKDKAGKVRRPRAQTPRGFRDYFGVDVAERNDMLRAIGEVYHRYGFDPLETSAVETVEALGKFLPDVDRPNEGVFAWEDDDEGWMALRYDLTAPLARVFAQHRNDLPTPYRRYAMGPVWRNEKPGPGRFRQFYQCDADTVGSGSVAADAEMCAMLCDTLETVGIKRGDYIVRVNNRKVLNGVLEKMQLGKHIDISEEPSIAGMLEGAAENIQRESVLKQDGELFKIASDVLRTVDKFDKIGVDGVRELLTHGRKDSSGAIIEGLRLADWRVDMVIEFLGAKGANDQITLENLGRIVSGSAIGEEGVGELEQISSLLMAQGYSQKQISIDPSVVRGLGYYTGPVYEAELTFEIKDEKGRPRQFGSVAGGGRYDDLVKRFTGQEVPATGVSIGVDRLLAALRATRAEAVKPVGPVVITVMDKARMADYQAMVRELREAGIRAEVFLGGGNMGKQLKYADRREAPVAVIEGEDEHQNGVVQLKDLALGARLAADIETHEDWKAQPAQLEVARGDLVSEVAKMIARAG